MSGLMARLQKKQPPETKLFRKFKKSKLRVDVMLYKEIRNNVQALKTKKENFSKKSYMKTGKPTDLWKITKKLGLPDKKAPTTSICHSTEKSWHFLPVQSLTLLKNILRILQAILLRGFLSLQENLEYLQCATINKRFNFPKKTT